VDHTGLDPDFGKNACGGRTQPRVIIGDDEAQVLAQKTPAFEVKEQFSPMPVIFPEGQLEADDLPLPVRLNAQGAVHRGLVVAVQAVILHLGPDAVHQQVLKLVGQRLAVNAHLLLVGQFPVDFSHPGFADSHAKAGLAQLLHFPLADAQSVHLGDDPEEIIFLLGENPH